MVVQCPEKIGPCVWRQEGACASDEIELVQVNAVGAPKTWLECATREEAE